MKLKECKAIVEQLLIDKPHLRSCDTDLMIEVLNFIEPGVTKEPFENVIKHCSKDGRFPTLETIRRTRQKLQEVYPDLAPSKEVESMRTHQQHKFFSFVIQRKV